MTEFLIDSCRNKGSGSHADGGPIANRAMDVAHGLRALQARLRTAPAAASNFIRAGGVSALLSLMASSRGQDETQLAAASLLTALVRKQPLAAAAAFSGQRGMAALVAMLATPAPGAPALQAEAAAQLLNVLLGVDVLAAGGDFCAAGGMAALRTLIANAPESPEGAQAAVELLAALVSGGPDSDMDAMTDFADAACAAGLLGPLLELASSAQDSSAEAALEVLRKLAASSDVNLAGVQASGALDALLELLRGVPPASGRAGGAVHLLRDLALYAPANREEMRDAGVPAACVSVMAGLPPSAPEATRPAARMAAHTLALLSGDALDMASQAGKSALHWAAQYGLPGPQLAQLARAAPGAVREADARGNTPLVLAALGASPGHLEAVRVLVDAGADVHARNAAGRSAGELAVQPGAMCLLDKEEAWTAAVGAPRSCHVLLAGSGAGAWQGPAKCKFEALQGCVCIASGGGSPPPSPVKQSRLKRLLGHSKAPQAAGEQRVCLDGARLVVLDARSLSIELPRAKNPDASLVTAERPRVARLLVWLNDEEADAGVLCASLELLVRRSSGEVAQDQWKPTDLDKPVALATAVSVTHMVKQLEAQISSSSPRGPAAHCAQRALLRSSSSPTATAATAAAAAPPSSLANKLRRAGSATQSLSSHPCTAANVAPAYICSSERMLSICRENFIHTTFAGWDLVYCDLGYCGALAEL
ncbi:hypothetical protein WJX81_007559 [Elliptochloris bilobata]|uniref:Uncharacterized protein n=1 Tax=Elliptochloris bilobata TaxID=381761 RepID=A0AAW1QHM2_9CHLO